MWGHSSSFRKNIILTIIIVLLTVLLGILLWMNKKEENNKSAEIQVFNAKVYMEEQEKCATLKLEKAYDSFYQKLADGFQGMCFSWE